MSPLGRTRKVRQLEANSPDESATLTQDGREIQVEIWRELVLIDQKPSPKNKIFDIYVFHDAIQVQDALSLGHANQDETRECA